MSVCVCVSVTFCVNVFFRVAKILEKITNSNIFILSFMSFLTLSFISKVKLLAAYLICKYLRVLINGVNITTGHQIGNTLNHRGMASIRSGKLLPWRRFSKTFLEILIPRKRKRETNKKRKQKFLRMIFTDDVTPHRTAPLPMMYVVTLIHIFNVKYLQY